MKKLPNNTQLLLFGDVSLKGINQQLAANLKFAEVYFPGKNT